MKVFKVTYEVVHYPGGVPLPIFFHPVYHVEARSFEEAIKRAEIAFNSHEDNKTLDREIVSMETVARPDDEDLILKLEDEQMNTLKIKKLHPDAITPTRSHSTDAGLDIYASETVVLKPQQKHLLKTDIAVDIPDGYVGFLTSRSGVSSKTNIVVETGKIDSGYNGEMKVNIKNDFQSEFMYDKSIRVPLYHNALNVKEERIYSERPLRGERNYLIQAGDKIAQLVIVPIVTPQLEIVDQFDTHSERGEKGFGSSDEVHP